jgi:hypothetical protein
MPWLPREVRALKRMRSRGLSAEDIAQVLDRTPLAVRLKVSRLKTIRKRRYRSSALAARRGN